VQFAKLSGVMYLGVAGDGVLSTMRFQFATIHHLATVERRVTAVKRLFEAVSSRHGRILIYVWAIEQDELSKRVIPALSQAKKTCADAALEQHTIGQDVFVPWVISSDNTSPKVPRMVHVQYAPENTPVAIPRYYHMFAKDELRTLVENAAQELGLKVCPASSNEAESNGTGGVEIVASGWERSNYYIELRRWQKIRQ